MPDVDVEVFAGQADLGGLSLLMQRVEVSTEPPSVTLRFGHRNWPTLRSSTVAGARAVFLDDSRELLITSPHATMVVTGAHRLPA